MENVTPGNHPEEKNSKIPSENLGLQICERPNLHHSQPPPPTTALAYNILQSVLTFQSDTN